MQSRVQGLDGVGAGLSALCLVHCLALPLAGSALPAVAGLAEAQWVDVAIFLLAAPVAVSSLLMPQHGRRVSRPVAAAGAVGLLQLAVGVVAPSPFEHWASIGGGLTLASAHLVNWFRRHAAR